MGKRGVPIEGYGVKRPQDANSLETSSASVPIVFCFLCPHLVSDVVHHLFECPPKLPVNQWCQQRPHMDECGIGEQHERLHAQRERPHRLHARHEHLGERLHHHDAHAELLLDRGLFPEQQCDHAVADEYQHAEHPTL